MDLSELHRVKRQERSTDSLQELRESFYADVADYLESLRNERVEAAAEADDPFRSSRVSELTNEIETAEHIAEAIYERRIGKLVDEATLAATGNGGNKSGLTAEEQDLYDDLVDLIGENKTAVLDQFQGTGTTLDETAESDLLDEAIADADGDPSEQDPTGNAESSKPTGGSTDTNGSDPITEAETSPADAMGPDLDDSSSEPTDAPTTDAADEAEPDVERTTVRMMTDVGEIFGVDAQTYELGENDIVDLPSENADPLLERDAAERVE